MLPNLIVIGSTKSGTTSLHRHLEEHPEIMMSTPKELRFFLEDWNWQGGSWQRGIEWYESKFDSSAPIRGESTPAYTTYPFVRDVPEKMARVIPSAKLLYIVRDPMERIVSDCLMTMRNHPEDTRTFLERIAEGSQVFRLRLGEGDRAAVQERPRPARHADPTPPTSMGVDEDPVDRSCCLQPRRGVDDVTRSHTFPELRPGTERH